MVNFLRYARRLFTGVHAAFLEDDMNICQEIEELRRHMRQMRKRIPAQTRALWSQDIRGNLDELLDSIKERREDRPLLVFAPMDEEINLWPWIKKCWEEGREQYFPLTKEGELRFYPASSVFDLEPGLWGIKEPVRRENPYQSGFAIAIVPGLTGLRCQRQSGRLWRRLLRSLFTGTQRLDSNRRRLSFSDL